MKLINFYLPFLIILLMLFFSACSTAYEKEEENDKKNDKNDQEISVDINTCFSDDDCIQSALCGCHTAEYVNKKIEEADRAGIMYSPCVHPPNSYCVCIDNTCQQLIDEEENDQENDKNDQEISVDINTCFSDDDCIQSALCGCHTAEYVNKKIEEADRAGIMYSPCVHPPNSYCVCIDNTCQQLIESR